MIDINGKNVKEHDIIRLYANYYFVIEDDGKLYGLQLEHPPLSIKMIDSEFEIVKNINSIL